MSSTPIRPALIGGGSDGSGTAPRCRVDASTISFMARFARAPADCLHKLRARAIKPRPALGGAAAGSEQEFKGDEMKGLGRWLRLATAAGGFLAGLAAASGEEAKLTFV